MSLCRRRATQSYPTSLLRSCEAATCKYLSERSCARGVSVPAAALGGAERADQEVGGGLLADHDAAGAVIGLEITTPHHVTAEQISAVVERMGLPRIDPDELASLRAT